MLWGLFKAPETKNLIEFLREYIRIGELEEYNGDFFFTQVEYSIII